MTRDEVVAYFESYIQNFNLPIKYGIQVNSVEFFGDHYLVRTSNGDFNSSDVVVATGLYQRPKIPAFRDKLSSKIQQLHSSEYRNPESLPIGAVLVVGSAQSGAQIAEELYQSGRKVYLSVSGAGRLPRRYRGKDVTQWMDELGFYARTVDQLTSPKDKFGSSAHGTGKDGGHTIDLHQFARDGVVLLGQIQNADDQRIIIAPNLKENLAYADNFEAEFVKAVDDYIDSNQLDIPPEVLPKLTDGYDIEEIQELDLELSDIHCIIWATGYTFNFSIVKLPVFDEDGYPLQNRGVSEFPGLYFIGLPFLYSGISGVIAGVGVDAEHIASVIASRGNAFKNETKQVEFRTII